MFRDIVVHVEPYREAGVQRLAVAARLAEEHEAHLTGLHVDPPPPVSVHEAGMPVTASPGMFAEEAIPPPASEEEADERTAAAEREFAAYAESLAASASWCAERGPIAPILALYARHADLAVIGPMRNQRPDPGAVADVVTEAGGPVLVVPPSWTGNALGRRVLVAWNATREASRAVRDAVPFLERAETVTVVTVTGADEEESAAAPGAGDGLDIARHLARHGVAAEHQRTPSNLATGEMLLSRAAQSACDLLVMGAWGHSRLRERLLGGATHDVLGNLTLPVVLSH